MTWHFDPSGETVDVYDPDGNVVGEDLAFSGSWSGHPADDLRDDIAAHLVETGRQDTETALLWAFEWLAGDVEEGTP